MNDTIFGSSAGLNGSTASFMTAEVENFNGEKMNASSLLMSVMVAVFLMGPSTPSNNTLIRYDTNSQQGMNILVSHGCRQMKAIHTSSQRRPS